MVNQYEYLEDWLCDVYVMECQVEMMIDVQLKCVGYYLQLQDWLWLYFDDMFGQQVFVEVCLMWFGMLLLVIKDFVVCVVVYGQIVSGMLVDDEVVKMVLVGYVFEQFQIVVYIVFVVVVYVVGEEEICVCCEWILQQECDMVVWLLCYLLVLMIVFFDCLVVDCIDVKW